MLQKKVIKLKIENKTNEGKSWKGYLVAGVVSVFHSSEVISPFSSSGISSVKLCNFGNHNEGKIPFKSVLLADCIINVIPHKS